ncbi:anti-phage-associated DUF1156 domain-containing protein [Methylobacterium aquaticum]|uniref:Adenine-specific DNA methylase containing a Zn-ribbon n=1 Tax=Methylobacterium aquaticum TaxID=270351 RepID=A0A0C6FSL6_9HYPH|nr:anti-phage-associated DUF1156 domain-containing protein [Methylobacterium aquaticum]BAQ45810.1 adenine-specific DNA methylase containing a Zn-ribbon [Methylobacterium aquaticum]
MLTRVQTAPNTRQIDWPNAQALIERLFPAQKVSVETKREFDAHGAQTLTALGSYWKGRKRLVYVRACVLAALLPATDDAVRDLEIFEKLMALDDEAFLVRETKTKASEFARLAIQAGQISQSDLQRYFRLPGKAPKPGDAAPSVTDLLAAMDDGKLVWSVEADERSDIRLAAYSQMSYEDKVSRSLRPEELPVSAYDAVWDDVNAHLGTSARSHQELVDQIGQLRFGRRPKLADPFCGAGSIPFEAARVGCDVYASDLNPVACMLTWGALHLVGGGNRMRAALEQAQKAVGEAVERRIQSMGIEHDEEGNRAKAYLYCVEVKCPATGWTVPLLPSLVISKIKKTVGRLVPDRDRRRFEIEIVANASPSELETAKLGTVRNKHLHYDLDGETYRTPIATIRGDHRAGRGDTTNRLRRWAREDIVPREDDILGERLYCIQWMSRETLHRARPETFFRAPTSEDQAREHRVITFVRENLSAWQSAGYVPNMEIEAGEKTDEPIRTRGWTYWHHLFTPRQLLIGALVAEEMQQIADEEVRACLSFDRTFVAHNSARLSQWLPGTPAKPGVAPSADTVKHVFYNQALNTFYNFGCRAYPMVKIDHGDEYKYVSIKGHSKVSTHPATALGESVDLVITDPPYADAVNYHEITEFFIAWLRKNPPAPFADWIWDSRRALAVKGDGEEFRIAMVESFRRMAECMPANGLQIVMFTHQSASVWADMAQIFWGAGLQVMAAWYVATETTSETKKGGYVQGTVTLVLRKRGEERSGFKDEIVHRIRDGVARQIETMIGLNQAVGAGGRIENLFEDADLQMAGYAAALRELTGYTDIDGVDMTREALRPRSMNERGFVEDIITFAVQVANEHMVPEGLDPQVWERLNGTERFYCKMLDIEMTGSRKLDNYQNFAKAFRVGDQIVTVMADLTPNKARLKSAADFENSFGNTEFGKSITRAMLYAVYELMRDVDSDLVLSHLRDNVEDYINRREDLIGLAAYVATKRRSVDETEARAARVLRDLIRGERLG